MKSLASIMLLFLLGSRVFSQGFENFPVDEAEPQTIASVPDKAMFERYLAEALGKELPIATGKTVVILIPEFGCGYCSASAIAFFKKHHSGFSNLQMIVAGNADQDSTYQLKKGQYISDRRNQCKQYGFEYHYPILALLQDRKILELLHLKAPAVPVLLEKALVFLQD